MSGEDHRKSVRLASVAFHAAVASDWPKATRAVQRLSDECGGPGLYLALVAWCDAYSEHACDGESHGRIGRMNWINAETGGLDGADSPRLPEPIRWAGNLVASRAALDEPRFNELINELPSDGLKRGEYFAAVLNTIVTTINGLPRGFARMHITGEAL